MSILYLPKEQQTTTMYVKLSPEHKVLVIEFYSNCGKFGMEEILAGYTFTADRLLKILNEREDITDEELT